MDWGGIWAVAWRYPLMAPVVVPLGAALFVLAVLILIVPPMLVLRGLIMIFVGSWILGCIVIVASSLATYFLWRGVWKNSDRFDHPLGL